MLNKTLDLKLKVLTPTFIRDGNYFNQFTSFLRKGKIYKFDIAKLIIKTRKTKEFIRKILSISTNTRALEEYLKNLKEICFKNKNIKEETLEEVIDSYIPQEDLKNIFRGIDTIYKDANYTPFIPGSSIKGVIRTLFLRYFLKKFLEKGILIDLLKYLSQDRENFSLKNLYKNLETLFTLTYIPQLISLSDLYPKEKYLPNQLDNRLVGAYRIYRIPHKKIPILSEGYNKNKVYKGKLIINAKYKQNKRALLTYFEKNLNDIFKNLDSGIKTKLSEIVEEIYNNFEEILLKEILNKEAKDYFEKIIFLKKFQKENQENYLNSNNINLDKFFEKIEEYEKHIQQTKETKIPLFLGSYLNLYSKIIIFSFKDYNNRSIENYEIFDETEKEIIKVAKKLNIENKFPKTFSITFVENKYLIPGLCEITLKETQS